jgi:putative lipoprotein
MLPAADAPGRSVTLRLEPDGTAILITQVVGKGSGASARARWTATGGGALTVTPDGQRPLVYEASGGRLVPREWDHDRYGATGVPLGRARTLAGSVIYRQRSALPPDALVRVTLEDVSRADAPAAPLAETTVETAGGQVPVSFEVAYDPASIDGHRRYTLRARIESGGRLLFANTRAYPVLTGADPAILQVVVDTAQDEGAR